MEKEAHMASFLDYLKDNFGKRSFQESVKAFMVWIIFFILVVALYYNIFSVMKEQIQQKEQDVVVREYSSRDLSNQVSDGNIVNITLDTSAPAHVVTVQIR